MSETDKTSRILGLAFLIQFATSFSSGVFLKSAWFVPDDMGATMQRIAAAPGVLQATILLDTLTGLGVIFLGAVLFATLRKRHEKIALTALGFYVLEATLLIASRSDAFSLLRLGQAYAAAPASDILLLGQVAYETMDFVGNTLHMVAFCFGAILFYLLLDKARIVPRWMSLWGLFAVFPLLIGSIVQVFGHSVPFVLYLPYVPFELVVGVWILIKGVEERNA